MTTVPRLEGLRPILVKELQVGSAPHRGRVLFGTVLTPCAVMTSVMTLVEDGNGDLVDIALYNDRKANRKLLVGRKIAILEPFFQLRDDGAP
jgi:hypothetical protein